MDRAWGLCVLLGRTCVSHMDVRCPHHPGLSLIPYSVTQDPVTWPLPHQHTFQIIPAFTYIGPLPGTFFHRVIPTSGPSAMTSPNAYLQLVLSQVTPVEHSFSSQHELGDPATHPHGPSIKCLMLRGPKVF